MSDLKLRGTSSGGSPRSLFQPFTKSRSKAEFRTNSMACLRTLQTMVGTPLGKSKVFIKSLVSKKSKIIIIIIIINIFVSIY